MLIEIKFILSGVIWNGLDFLSWRNNLLMAMSWLHIKLAVWLLKGYGGGKGDFLHLYLEPQGW